MLLYVTGPEKADEAVATAFFNELAGSWAAVARATTHPRTGLPMDPVLTRFDMFMAAYAGASEPAACGLRVAIPPPEAAYMWGIPLRRALRELVAGAFPITPRLTAPFDPVGPRAERPNRAELPSMLDIVDRYRAAEDPAQVASDPRLWLVLAPPMTPEVELMFLPAFLRAEPFARVVRAPAERPAGWLEGEVRELVAGRGLTRHGLIASSREGEPRIAVTHKDAAGAPVAQIVMLEATCGLEETYAWRAVLYPGQTYARLHSHSGSEELYVILSGSGVLRVNERVFPVKAGDCFGKPRNYGTSTQLINTGTEPMELIDAGSMNRSEVDVLHYPEHGEMLARMGGHKWIAPLDALRPGAEFWALYDRRYFRSSKGPTGPDK